MLTALAWGALAASSLLVGAVLGALHVWPTRLTGRMLAFGAGALISAVSFDLAEDGASLAGGLPVGIGLGLGAVVYFLANRWLNRRERASGSASSAGSGLALGAFLDGIPEQVVLGIGMRIGPGVSVGLLAAVFVSNLPESIGSATEMREAGVPRRRVLTLWTAIAVTCALASPAGYVLAGAVSPELQAALSGFAAGALLVMLVDEMIPQARTRAGDAAGLWTVLGFAVGAALSAVPA